MAIRSVTVNLPDPLYARLKRRAEQTQRTIEAELLEVVPAAVPQSDELAADLAEAIAPLALLDDDSLWRAARSHLPEDASARLEALHFKQQHEGLSTFEDQTRAALVQRYEQAMLVRSEAAALLKQRGHDVSDLLTPPPSLE